MSFQDFDPPPIEPEDVRRRVAALRASFEALGVDGIVVPHEDEYQSEHLPPGADRLAQVTGFTGSAGHAIILKDKALFATDGRYALQAAAQVPQDIYHIASTDEAAKAWLSELGSVRLGIDANLHTRADRKRLAERVAPASLVPLDANPVDRIRNERPPAHPTAIRLYPDELAGMGAADKLKAVRGAMEGDAVLIAASDAVSWLFNWRGGDVPHTPLVLSRAFIPREGEITVFVDPGKVTGEVLSALEGIARLVDPADYLATLGELSRGKTVSADPKYTSDAALAAIEAAGSLREARDPTLILKAVKNAAEINGMRRAHQRDGVALTRFLAWFDANAAGRTEIDLAERLEALRREAGAVDVSFDTIAGSGPNGAIVHYRVDRRSNRTVQPGDAVLIDSGAQYTDGTTDVTRTVCAGAPSDTFCERFTAVLKGHIALARQRFPKGTRGVDLDPLARAALWQLGCDYNHGTGHGVGAYLSVHEGPQGISRRSMEPLVPGMIVSNEPGYYKAGAYGIRIENLCVVRPPEPLPSGDIETLSFETLTLAPIDTRLVAAHHLTAAETAWLDTYHARVRGALVAELDKPERDWLETRCRPLA